MSKDSGKFMVKNKAGRRHKLFQWGGNSVMLFSILWFKKSSLIRCHEQTPAENHKDIGGKSIPWDGIASTKL
jgi:hypothetical protein